MCQGNGERQLLTFAFLRVKIENVENKDVLQSLLQSVFLFYQQ